MASKYGSVRSAAKGKQRSGKKRVGTRGATFKDAPRPRSKKMVTRYVEPVVVEPVESMDTGATKLSIENPEDIRREIPAPKCVGLEEHVCGDEHACVWNVRKNKPRRGWWIGCGVARLIDARHLSKRYDVGRSTKQLIGKQLPVTDKTPVIERVKD